MEKITDSLENANYNDETIFLDGVAEFHPEVIESLSVQEQELLQKYYLLGAAIVENIFEYRRYITLDDPTLEFRAKEVFKKVLKKLGIQSFTYTTKV